MTAGNHAALQRTPQYHATMSPQAVPMRRAPRPRWLFVWLLPLLWCATSAAATRHPGDEYAMFAVGALAGAWIIPLVGESGSFLRISAYVIVAGGVTVGMLGLVLDLLRAPRRLWLIAWLVSAALLVLSAIGGYPSYQRALSKHGSLWAYILNASNLGLCAATLIALPAGVARRLLARRRRPQGCIHCGYDQTGNVSGVCPECGRATPDRVANVNSGEPPADASSSAVHR
jgi:hypothetical protein